METNSALFNRISKIKGHSLYLSLDENFKSEINSFRKLTSRIRRLNDIDYPVVYLSCNDYGGLTISHGNTKLRLIVNLQFYYVFGFYLDDGKVYAFSGSSEGELTNFGFDCETIPYRDGYHDIRAVIGETGFNELLATEVSLAQLIPALDQLANFNIPFSDKARSILIVFWSLVEGIRFAGISHVILDLQQNYPNKTTYQSFYNLAEVWTELCEKAADDKTLNPDIAVYHLDHIK